MKQNIALLTGRGGSISIKDKNVMKILDRPLMTYPYFAAKHARLIDDIYISTDGDKLKNVAKIHGIKIIHRPPELAMENSQHVDCIIHALKHLKQEGIKINILVVMLCNVATHEVGAIDAALSFLTENPEYDCCVTISQMEENHPAIAKKAIEVPIPLEKVFKNDLIYLRSFLENEHDVSREKMRACYFLTHSFWAMRVDNCFKDNGQPPWNFMGKKIAGLIMKNGVDVHDIEDTAYSECWLQMRGWTTIRNPFVT